MGKFKSKIALSLLVLSAILLIAFWTLPALRWRASIIGLKTSGSLPNLPWGTVLSEMIPKRGGRQHVAHKTTSLKQERAIPKHPIKRQTLRSLVVGDVTVIKVEPQGACPTLWDTPMGSFWARFSDGDVLELMVGEQLHANIYNHETIAIRPRDVVVDVGAHVGTFTRFALTRGARLVVAFEPEPVNIQCFKRNFSKEIEDGRVILIEAAAWNVPGTLSFTSEVPNSGMARVDVGGMLGGNVIVKAVTIDDTIKDLGLKHVDFIKMDIEGAEQYALEGATATLSRFGPRLAVCIYHVENNPEEIIRVVLDANPTYQLKKNKNLQAYFYHKAAADGATPAQTP